MPRLAVVAFVVLTVALFVGLPGTAMDLAQAAQVIVAGALAVPLWRSVRPLDQDRGGSGKNIEVRAAYSG